MNIHLRTFVGKARGPVEFNRLIYVFVVGGQPADTGVIKFDNTTFEVSDVRSDATGKGFYYFVPRFLIYCFLVFLFFFLSNSSFSFW